MPAQGFKHLVFYDGTCGLCDHAVQFILKRDHERLFAFAPLDGKTAEKFLKIRPDADSLILIENFQSPKPQTFILGKGAFRILWMLGGSWSLLGIISFCPSIFYDWAYRIVAKNRYRLFPKTCSLPKEDAHDRFLP